MLASSWERFNPIIAIPVPLPALNLWIMSCFCRLAWRRMSISESTTFHRVSNILMPCVLVAPFLIRTRIVHPSSWGISPVRHMCCTISTKHRQRSLYGGSSTATRGTAPVTTVWSATRGGVYVRLTCVGVGGVPLPPPPPPMGSCRSPCTGWSVFPGADQRCVAPTSDRGSVSSPWPSPYPSRRDWEPARMRANTRVSVWRMLRGGPTLLRKAPYTPQSPLLTPLLASRSTK